MTKKLIQSSHPGRKTFKKLYEQEKFIKLTQDQFFAESETVYTRSQTRLAIIPQSLIVNHNVNDNVIRSGTNSWDSLWFSDPKKGKHFYTRLFQQDQLIQEYTTGFFRSFGFYQEKCIVERNCSQEIHITSYVLRTPKLQRSKIDQLRSPKETPLKLGLEEGWIPTLIL